VQASGAIAVGGCVIDVENGRVDLRLDVQLDSIERALTQPEV
jgi:flagellar biosynthesis/type III secretory pathway protein FliH